MPGKARAPRTELPARPRGVGGGGESRPSPRTRTVHGPCPCRCTPPPARGARRACRGRGLRASAAAGARRARGARRKAGTSAVALPATLRPMSWSRRPSQARRCRTCRSAWRGTPLSGSSCAASRRARLAHAEVELTQLHPVSPSQPCQGLDAAVGQLAVVVGMRQCLRLDGGVDGHVP